MIEICGVGGYDEVGRNMVAVKAGNEAAVFDMGFQVQKLVDFEEEGGLREGLTREQMIQLHAIPDDTVLGSWRGMVKAIALSHCHLDHIGAVPYLERGYRAPIYGTPFTMAVLRHMLKHDEMSVKNKMQDVETGKIVPLTKDMSLEFVYITHSTPQSSFVALHTKQGIILYATDYKFDNHPVIGGKPDYERLKELKDEGVIAMFVDSLYSRHDMKTPSEKVAREMLKDILFGTENRGNAIVGTCFASHIARLKSFIEFGRALDRKVVLLGRTMMKYCEAAAEVGIVDFRKEAEIVGYGRDVKKKLKEIEKQGAGDYLIVCSGGQGEHNSVLRRMMRNDYPFQFMNEDHVIFSNRIIPVEPNITNREEIERRLKELGVRIFKDIHVSGHAAREDIRDLINIIEPEHVIPCHGPHGLVGGAGELAEQMGYKMGKDVHLLENGKKILLS